MNFIRNQYNYKYYLLEKSIEVGDDLMKKLDSINSPLSKKVKEFLTSDEISDKADITKIEYDDTDNKVFTIVDEKGGERKLKFGKLLKYLGYDNFDKIKGYEIENFILNFKKSDESNNLQLRKGDDILKSYLCYNYDKLSGYGGLGHSCMRFKRSQEYLKIYTENPDRVSCLTLINPDNNKVRGRALIWKLDNGKYYMDRIYVSNNEFKSIFLEYAEKNNIETSSPSDDVTLSNKKEYEFYPYMDTFIHYTPDTGVLSDVEGDLTLQSTTGGHSGDTVWSDRYHEDISRDEAVFSEYYSDFIYRHDAVEVYTTIDPEDDTRSETSYVFDNQQNQFSGNSEYYTLDYASEKYSKYRGEDIINSLLVELEAGDIYVLEQDEDIYTHGDWGIFLIEEEFDDDTSDFEVYSFSKEVTYKDDSYYGEHVPYSDVTSIWNKEENKIVIATHDNVLSFSFNRGQEVQSEYDSEEDYVEIEMISDIDIKKFTETIYLPESFFTDVDKLIFSNKSPVYKNIKGDMEIKDIDTIDIHDGIYLTKKEVEKYTVKTPSGPKVFPLLMLPSKFNSFTEIKDYYIENKILPDKKMSKFFKSFNRGAILDKELMKIVDSGLQVFDFFKSAEDTHDKELMDLISYASKELDYDLSIHPSYLVSLVSFYDYNYSDDGKDGIKVFPFLNKGDKYLVKRYGKYVLYTANQISNFIQSGAI